MDTSTSAQHEPELYRRIASPIHTILVLAVEGILVWRGTAASAQMRATVNPNRVHLYWSTMFFEWLVFGIVILGVWLGGSSLFTVLGDRWRSVRRPLSDTGIAMAFWIVSVLVLSMVGGHQHGSAPDHAVRFLLPQGIFEKTLWIALSVTAGICEEAVYRGYFQRQITALTKSVPLGIVLSAAAFGGAHAYQGLHGALMIAFQGAMLGILAYWRGSVRPGMIAHAWGDIFAGVLASALRIPVG